MVVELVGIKNNEKDLFLIFKKNQAIIKLLKKIVISIDVQQAPVLECFEDLMYTNSSEDVKESELIEREVKSIKDEYLNFNKGKYLLNIIFGDKKVFLNGYFQ